LAQINHTIFGNFSSSFSSSERKKKGVANLGILHKMALVTN